MMKILEGNILDIQEGIIAHQVNCQRVAGAGLALQIKKKWPLWWEDFKNTTPSLGMCCLFSITPHLHIANLYAQESYGRGTKQTDYEALRSALNDLYFLSYPTPTYIPFGIGCGLGGGDWNTVLQILEDEVPHTTLVKLPLSRILRT